jgi:hypothetical protein
MNLITVVSEKCLSFENYEDDTHVFDIDSRDENNEVEFTMNLDVDGFYMKLNQDELKVLINYLQKQLIEAK